MRVAYVCADPGVPVFGCKGSSIHVQELIRAMLRIGAHVDLFASRLGGEAPEEFDVVRFHELPKFSGTHPANREQSAIDPNRDLYQSLQRTGPFDVVYERYSLWSCAGMDYARDSGVPGLLEVNAPLIDEQIQHRSPINRESAEAVARQTFGSAAALIAVSDGVADYLRQYPISDNCVHVVSNGVDPSRFSADHLANAPTAAETFTIGFVGTLKPWHGLTKLVEVFEKLYECDSSYRLLIVGDGPERERLVTDLSSRRDALRKAVRITGSVRPQDVPDLLASMDVAVAPYPRSSNFYFSPLKVYEYMAAGLPVVASRVAGLDRLIQDGINGLLTPAGDVDALAAAISSLRESPQRMIEMGRAAREAVCKNHTWDAVLQKIFRRAGIERQLEPSCSERRE